MGKQTSADQNNAYGINSMNSEIKMSKTAREAQRAYNREYYAKNRERIQQKRAERWERMATEAANANKISESLPPHTEERDKGPVRYCYEATESLTKYYERQFRSRKADIAEALLNETTVDNCLWPVEDLFKKGFASNSPRRELIIAASSLVRLATYCSLAEKFLTEEERTTFFEMMNRRINNGFQIL